VSRIKPPAPSQEPSRGARPDVAVDGTVARKPKRSPSPRGGKPEIHPAAVQDGSEKSEDARTRIIEGANILVGRDGFEGTSIRDIARESKTNPALVYYYFGSKDGLFTALANENADRAGAVLREAAKIDGTARERARHFLSTWLKAVCQSNRPLAPWFRKAIHSRDEHGEVLRARVAGNIRLLADILEEGISKGELRTLPVPVVTAASGLMMSVAGLAMEVLLPHRHTGVDLTSERSRLEFIDGMLDLWFDGLRGRS
jgi:AcrR family transcriptional regulator